MNDDSRARVLCDLLREDCAEPAPILADLRALGVGALPALTDLLRERGAGYAYAVRLLGALDLPPARDVLAEVLVDGGARDCDRLEAALSLDDAADPRGLAALRALSASMSPLRTAAYFALRARPDGLSVADLVHGPYLDDPEVRPLVVEDLRARGVDPGGPLDDPAERARFRAAAGDR
jgi:hypothetical protein